MKTSVFMLLLLFSIPDFAISEEHHVRPNVFILGDE